MFGEIAARPPGARVVDLMNYSCDADLYAGWAEAVLHGQPPQRRSTQKYNAGSIFKRAHGDGPHHRASRASTGCWPRYGEHVVLVDLLPVGAPRRDWRTTIVGDGWVVVRHHDLQTVIEMTDAFAADLQLYAS